MRDQARATCAILATVIYREMKTAVISALKYWKRRQQVRCFAVGV